MKTHILRLDPHDDVISTKDKMGWSKAGRILLVWPERERVLDRRLDLVLLRRHSRALGAQLAIICRDREVGKIARELAIPVFKNMRQAQRSPWRVARRQRVKARRMRPRKRKGLTDLEQMRRGAHPSDPAWVNRPQTRLAAFLIGILAVLSIAAAVIPTAEVHLDPQTRQQSVDLEVVAERSISQVTLTGRIPLHAMTVEVEGRDTITPTGQTTIPAAYASGRITFTNLTSDLVEIPAGSLLRTQEDPPVRFETRQAITLPPGAGQRVSTTVRAIEPGESGNLPANSLVAVEGPLGLRVTAANALPTNGGSNQTTPAPSEQDRRKLFQNLSGQLSQTALDEIGDSLSPGDILFSASISTTQVLAETYSPAEDEPSDTLELQLRLETQALYVLAEDLENLANAALDATQPSGFQAVAGSLQLSRVTSPRMDADGRAVWRMRATRHLDALIQTESVTTSLLGRPVAEALHNLEVSLPLDESPAARLFPEWWPRMPLLPFRIGMVIDENTGR